MKLSNLQDLLVEELKDLYDAEKQILKALPRMAKKANSEELAAGFNEHLEQTKGQVNRLEQIFQELGKPVRGKKCEGLHGLLEEGKEMMGQDAEPAVKDAALISAAQRVEHYEIAGYGSVRTLAQLLGHDHIAQLLQETLDEEKATDEKLTQLAKSINAEAREGDHDHGKTTNRSPNGKSERRNSRDDVESADQTSEQTANPKPGRRHKREDDEMESTEDRMEVDDDQEEAEAQRGAGNGRHGHTARERTDA